ncbi:hypothetical protein [Aureispira anguillae]|uniref:Uncharacterized protein n=1 Tax=Aureispira anguillae TaxID=2864201 RepID=A0A915YIA5_9BACT|nr:hypothetical protein [Aureispira anguillae]BDS13486.1 hypothetical protein AsAng_0042240 [Aureispira anguillae]
MQLQKLRAISYLFILLLIVWRTIDLQGQHIIKTKKKKSKRIILGFDKHGKCTSDTSFLFKFTKQELRHTNKGELYHLWKNEMALGTIYYLQKRTLDSSCNFQLSKPHWCNQFFFNKALKQGKYIRLRKKGIVLLFKDGSRLKISYQQLDQQLLQDILEQKRLGIKAEKIKDTCFIKGVCKDKQTICDTLYLDNFSDYKVQELYNHELYYLWKDKRSPSETYYLQKCILDSNCQFQYGKIHYCQQMFFDKKLKKGNYMIFRNRGILILFEDGSRHSISFQQLDQTLLQDILTIESID